MGSNNPRVGNPTIHGLKNQQSAGFCLYGGGEVVRPLRGWRVEEKEGGTHALRQRRCELGAGGWQQKTGVAGARVRRSTPPAAGGSTPLSEGEWGLRAGGS